MIYMDMDGVIADFFSALAWNEGVSHWKDIDNVEKAISKLANTEFFYNIPVFRENDTNVSYKIVELVKDAASLNDLKWGICSSPLCGDEYNSAYWKREWLTFHGYMPDVQDCIFTQTKEKYAFSIHDRKPNILIDDKPENIYNFRKAGGLAIRFQANEDDIEYLEAELDFALSARNEI